MRTKSMTADNKPESKVNTGAAKACLKVMLAAFNKVSILWPSGESWRGVFETSELTVGVTGASCVAGVGVGGGRMTVS